MHGLPRGPTAVVQVATCATTSPAHRKCWPAMDVHSPCGTGCLGSKLTSKYTVEAVTSLYATSGG